MKKINKCAIVIPLYKNKLETYEKDSIDSARRCFNNDDIYFVCPNGLNIDDISKNQKQIIRFDGKYFRGIEGYCLLCTSPFFYKAFLDLGYDYMLIHQTDTYTFYNNLNYFMGLDYGYYGAQIPGLYINPRSYWYKSDGVGNGGYSLRKLSTLYEITKKYGPTTKTEDAWFCVDHKKEINKCPVDIAKLFSTINASISGVLPMACHGYIVKHGTYKKYNKNTKKMDSTKTNKKVVYTCITGGYDTLNESIYITPGYDYICFTDDMSLTSNKWVIRPLPEEVYSLDNARRNRYVKTHPHILLPEYETSVYVDGCIEIRNNLDKFVNSCDLENYVIAVPKHPSRECLYKEGKICISIKKDTPDHINPQMEKYRAEGFPENYGLTQNNIIVRKHNDPLCIKAMEEWWDEIKNHSHRDQLSFMYTMWKNPELKLKQLDAKTCDSIYFKWNKTHPRGKRSVSTSIQTAKPIVERKNESETVKLDNMNSLKVKTSMPISTVKVTHKPKHIVKKTRVFLGTGLNWY